MCDVKTVCFLEERVFFAGGSLTLADTVPMTSFVGSLPRPRPLPREDTVDDTDPGALAGLTGVYDGRCGGAVDVDDLPLPEFFLHIGGGGGGGG